MTQILDHTVNFLAQEESYEWIEANFSAHHRRLARLAADRILNTSMVRDVPLGPLLSLQEVERIRCPVLSILGRYGLPVGRPGGADRAPAARRAARDRRPGAFGTGRTAPRGAELVLAWIARQAG